MCFCLISWNPKTFFGNDARRQNILFVSRLERLERNMGERREEIKERN